MKYLLFSLLFVLTIFSSASFAQGVELNDCELMEFEVSDNTDMDSDGDICEGHFSISNSASYSSNSCNESPIFWVITIDLYSDEVVDFEYRSDLPESDITLDDTDGNGIPDLYIAPTMNNEEQIVTLTDIDGPFSEHEVTWVVRDDCGFEDLCLAYFNLVDNKAPTPFCLSLSTVQLQGDSIELVAADFNLGVFDNCTDQEDIIISFDSLGLEPTRFFTCDDVLNSPQVTQVFFTDQSGNFDFCNVYLIIEPDVGIDCYPLAPIVGRVTEYDSDPIVGATVTLDANLPEYPRQTVTDENGEYRFNNTVSAMDYTLSVDKDGAPLEDVTTLDLVYIVRHILGLQPLNSPYLHFAADVGNDGNVRVNDVIILRKLILGVIGDFPTNQPWRFFEADYNFDDPTAPFSNPPPSILEFRHLGDNVSYDFIGVKTGNVY